MSTYINIKRKIYDALRNNSQRLNLDHLNLTSIPKEVRELSKLKILNLEHNSIQKITSDQLPKNIEVLYVNDNELESISLNEMLSSSLKVIRLTNNRLGAFPDNFRKLSECRRIFLTNNNITSIPRWIKELRNLEILSIGHNKISIIPEEILSHESLS
jgi:Leucine-rich repeat (LRR) protein